MINNTPPYIPHQNLRLESLSGKDQKELGELKKATQEFESFFIQKMLDQMKKSHEDEGFFKKSHATKTFEKMLNEELAKEMAKAGGIGLGDHLYQQLLKSYSSSSLSEKKEDDNSAESILSAVDAVEK